MECVIDVRYPSFQQVGSRLQMESSKVISEPD